MNDCEKKLSLKQIRDISIFILNSVVCKDKRKDCPSYARVPGFCQRISQYMKEYCRKSCGFCNGRDSWPVSN